MLNIWRTLFWFELVLFFRRAHEWIYPLIFFTIVLCLFPIAISPDPQLLQKIAPGAVWIAALLASILGLEHNLQSDREEGHLEQLILNAHPKGWLLLAKMSAHWVATQLPLILFLPVVGWLFHLTGTSTLNLMLTLLLGTPILSMIGALGAALTLGLRHQGVMLGMLIFPLCIPIVILGVMTVQQEAANLPVSGNLALMCALCLFTLSMVPWVVGVLLKLAMED